MATVNLFFDPVFRDGAFTANDARVRAYALQKTMRAMDIGAELGAQIFVLVGRTRGRRDRRLPAPGRGGQAAARGGELPLRVFDRSEVRISASRSRRSRTSRAATSTWRRPARISGSSRRCDHPEMVGVNPEVAHEQMAGLNFLHAVAQAWEAGKLFHIDLNDQVPGRYDQDFRFGSANIKSSFLLVKFLEDVGYDGPRHFDAHAYRTEDYDGVRDFARGCMRTYLILREKARQWNADAEIQALVKSDGAVARPTGPYSPQHRDALLAAIGRSRCAGQQRARVRAARSADDRPAAGSTLNGANLGRLAGLSESAESARRTPRAARTPLDPRPR